jgi:asparagine synthase (glutamine-hydrolysing)
MCGINGIFGLERLSNPEEIIAKMNNTLAHRGPDAKGVASFSNVILGHQRLSIIDLNEASNQPMYSADGKYCMVFNGEIYNYLELKEKLEKKTFSTNSDSEILLQAFIEMGEDVLKELNGMFAFAIWDVEKQKLFVARDRMGIKPFYYFYENENFIFSSELRAILSTGLVPKKLSKKGLHDYLRYQTVHSPNTIVENIQLLPQGHCAWISDSNFEIKQYWNPEEISVNKDSKEETKERINQLFKDSVKRRLVADVPFGAFLSGGIDSSAVVAMMAQESSKVKSFSVTFEEEEFSERKYAELIANKFDTDHQNIELRASDLKNQLPDILSSMDHPSGDGPNTYVISQAVKKAGVTMALSGLGGDELFCGYDVFTRLPELDKKKWIMSFPPLFRRWAAGALRGVKRSVAGDKMAELLSLDYWDFPEVYSLTRKIYTESKLNDLVSGSLHENTLKNKIKNSVGFETKGFALPYLSKVSWSEMQSYMQSVLLRDSDQMSMAHALEIRVPFLDHTLVEYAMSIPDHHKYPSYPKQLLVESLGDLLPNEIVHRKKMGFTLPWQHWMKNELKEFCEHHINSLSKREYFNETSLKSLWKDFLNGNPRVTWSRLWPLICLNHWLETNEIE